MPTPGEEIRRARLAQGLSQEQLAKLAGVSSKTIGRIERGQDYDDPRTIPVVRASLGLDDTDLSKISAEALGAEIIRRLIAAERILDHARIRTGDAPATALNDPDVLRPNAEYRRTGDTDRPDS